MGDDRTAPGLAAQRALEVVASRWVIDVSRRMRRGSARMSIAVILAAKRAVHTERDRPSGSVPAEQLPDHPHGAHDRHVAAAAGAAVGALWALLISWVVGRIAHRPRVADRSVVVAAFLAAILLGGSTFAMLAYAAAYADGAALVAFASAPIAGGFLFFVSVNTAIEWLALPVVLHLSWASRRHRLVVVAALLYFAMRASTYLYFAPAIMELGAAPVDAEAIASLRTWVLLSVPRWAVDVVLVVLLLLASRRTTTVGASSTTVVSA